MRKVRLALECQEENTFFRALEAIGGSLVVFFFNPPECTERALKLLRRMNRDMIYFMLRKLCFYCVKNRS